MSWRGSGTVVSYDPPVTQDRTPKSASGILCPHTFIWRKPVPYTLNGIGTHYYGAGNRSARLDVCRSCGRSATLSSYDTREWICVVFIPLIPLRKYRILNDCSSCRRHHRIAANEFAQKLAEVTAPLRGQMRHSPQDPEPQIALVRALIGWEMRADAEKEL